MTVWTARSPGLLSSRYPVVGRTLQSLCIDDGALVARAPDFPAGIRGNDLENMELAVASEVTGGGGYFGSDRRRRRMSDLDTDADRELASRKAGLEQAGAGYLHEGDHARRGKHFREDVGRNECQRTGQLGWSDDQLGLRD